MCYNQKSINFLNILNNIIIKFTDSAKKEFIRPRRVKIIVKGTKPRKASRFLLNKKTAVAFDQVLSAITESIKPEWGAVRKVFTLDGNEVSSMF